MSQNSKDEIANKTKLTGAATPPVFGSFGAQSMPVKPVKPK
jgi:hypothetical protein